MEQSFNPVTRATGAFDPADPVTRGNRVTCATGVTRDNRVTGVNTGRISRRVGAMAQSATLAVSAKARELRAAGVNVIGFGVGEPDFPTAPHIVEAAVAACQDPRHHKYSPVAGLPELREAVAAKTTRDSGFDVHPDQVLITNGVKHAVYNAFASIINPGDEVLLSAPYWTTYPEQIAAFGGVAVPVAADISAMFRVSVDQLETACTSRTKALVFVSPSNPTGAVYSRDEVEAIGRWAAEKGIWVITDEIYEYFVYDDHTFYSMPALVPDIQDRCIVLNGVAKSHAMTGWRVGWMIAPTDVAAAAKNLQSHSTSNVCNVAQAAALAALSGGLDSVADMLAHFNRRRHIMRDALANIDGLRCFEPQGAFYMYCDATGVLGRDIKRLTSTSSMPTSTIELADVLLNEAAVAVVPGEAFGVPGGVRLSYALKDEDMNIGLTRIAELFG